MIIHKGKNVLVIDLEFARTYKRKLNKSSIMEIGMIFVRDFMLPSEQKFTYTRQLNPGVGISRYATKVTGITPRMIKKCKPIEFYHDEIQQFIDEADILVFHGGTLDIDALENTGFNIKNKTICDTQELAKRDYRGFSRYSLGDLAKDLKITDLDLHRALDDAIITLEIYRRLVQT